MDGQVKTAQSRRASGNRARREAQATGWRALGAIGLILGILFAGASAATAEDAPSPEPPAILRVTPAPAEDDVQDPNAAGAVTGDPEGVSVGDGAGEAPLPAEAEPEEHRPAATQEPHREGLLSVVMAYFFDGSFVGIEQFELPEGSLITSRDLTLPPGFELRAAFLDYTVFEDAEISIEVVKTQTPIPRYTVTVVYEHDGVEVGRQTKDNLPENFVIHDEDLVIPTGYVQRDPMPPHLVVADATLTVPVLTTPDELWDITVWFLHGDARVGLQIYQQLPPGAIITEATLVLPTGYRLAEPFLDYRVTGAAELFLRVMPEPSVTPTPTPTPTPSVTPTPSLTPETPGPSAPTTSGDRDGVIPHLAETGAGNTAPLMTAALAAALTGAILLGRHRRRQVAG